MARRNHPRSAGADRAGDGQVRCLAWPPSARSAACASSARRSPPCLSRIHRCTTNISTYLLTHSEHLDISINTFRTSQQQHRAGSGSCRPTWTRSSAGRRAAARRSSSFSSSTRASRCLFRPFPLRVPLPYRLGSQARSTRRTLSRPRLQLLCRRGSGHVGGRGLTPSSSLPAGRGEGQGVSV